MSSLNALEWLEILIVIALIIELLRSLASKKGSKNFVFFLLVAFYLIGALLDFVSNGNNFRILIKFSTAILFIFFFK